MDVDVFLDKNQLLSFVNEKLLESSFLLGRWLVVNDFISVQSAPQPFQLVVGIKWNLHYLPFVKRISNIKLILEEGKIPKFFRKGNQIIIQGWKSILNDFICKYIKSLNLKDLDVWPDLNEVEIYIRQVQTQNNSLRITLIISGHLAIELHPDYIPLIHSNGVKFDFASQSKKCTPHLNISLNVFNGALRKLSKQIPFEKIEYMGFVFGKVLLKLKKRQLHIITQIKHPFKGYTETSCGIVLDKKTERLNLIDVESKLESNNILAHMAHLGFKRSIHLIIINQLEMIINHKIKEAIIQQLSKVRPLNGVTLDYNQLQIEDDLLGLNIRLNGKITVNPDLFVKSY